MDADLYDSFLRITWDPDGEDPIILLDFGDAMWREVTLDGGQVVQESPAIRAVGIRTFPRGNERHELSFEKASIENSMQAAFARRMYGILGLPRGSAPVLIELESGEAWQIASCSVGSWPGGQMERFTREGVTIVGGSIIEVILGADGGIILGGSYLTLGGKALTLTPP